MSKDLTRVEEILASYDYEPHHLIAIMQDIQSEYKYLSQDMLCLIAQKLGLSIAKVYSVATFYENFSLSVTVPPVTCANPVPSTTPSAVS